MHRRSVVLATAMLFSSPILSASRQGAPSNQIQPVGTGSRFELTVDSIMRGPDLVGYPPTGLRWSADSQKLYFEWRKPGEREASTYVVTRSGGDPRKLSDDESKSIPPATGGRWDAAHRRVLFVDDGDVVLVDSISGTRQQVTRTTGAESNPRWARNDTHITYVREGNLFDVALDATGPALVAQLTDVGPRKPDARLTDSQKFIRDEEEKLIGFLKDQKFYVTSTEVHPGERQVYSLAIDGGSRTRLTTMTGSNDGEVSPDDRMMGLVYSYSTKPPEVYLMANEPGAQARQVTTTPTAEWRAFKWIDPRIVTYKARDGADVHARLFTPDMIGARRDATRPGVVFVHGAGYAQNAHRYWASYFREYMFHNLLASRGYVVLDVDYRASSGYGRDWRTAIYRHMGGKDLEDVVDGARYLTAQERVDPRRIGVYGGSYGGFITLMAMFTTPDVFAAGAALRPVTDWAHYNHTYTSNILNLPQKDADAYRKSSPIYFADGLKGALLICHGMVDTNVFFQDSVRLAQRLIELRKENWELAAYPVENHGFTEATSWADEFRRILKLFEDNLRLKGGKVTN